MFLLIALAQVHFGLCSIVQPPSSPKIKLIENKGQWDPQVLFKAAIPGGDLYITRNAFVYALIDEKAMHDVMHGTSDNMAVKGHNYRVRFVGSNESIGVQKELPASESYNYFLGNDITKWASDCKAYERVWLRNMYSGIDVEVVAGNDVVKINYHIHSGAKTSDIRLVYEGTDAMAIRNNALQIETSVAQIKEEEPYAYQSTGTVSCRYLLSDSVLSFETSKYDLSQTLIIDPNIVFSTYSGSVADNFGFTATFDTSGNAYAGGTVFSSGFPVTTGAYQRTFAGGSGLGYDMSILKFSADGTRLLYATYLGGSSNEQPHSIICNNAGELYILGTTESPNFPVTSGAYDISFNGRADIVVSMLSSDGKQLLASTYFGGTLDDGINGRDHSAYVYNSYNNPLAYNFGDFYRGEIKLDANGNVVIASSTLSRPVNGFPIVNGFQTTFGGGYQDGCILRLSADLSSLLFSSYLGGNGDDALYGVAFDNANNILVTGGTNSRNLGKNQGTLTYQGGIDGFIGKISPSGFSIQKVVYVGTSSYDQSYFIDVDADNLIYITGQSTGSFPVKGNVYNNIEGRQFISILNNNLDSFMYSMVFGNGGVGVNLSPSALMVDNCGKVYVSGWGGSSNAAFHNEVESTFGLETTPDAFQSSTDGSDFYLIVLSKHLSALKYATYIGGSNSSDHVDGGTSRFDKRGIVYQSICAGCGGFSDLPTTPGAYSRTNKGKRPNSNVGGCNNAVVKFGADPSDSPPTVRDTIIYLTAQDSLQFKFTITDPDGDSVNVQFTGAILSQAGNPASISKTTGADFVTATLKWKTLCSNAGTDTFKIFIEAADNACFTPNLSHAVIKILVNPPPPPIAPVPSCLVTLNDSTVQLKWNPTGAQQTYATYKIYRKTGNNPFAMIFQSDSTGDTMLIDKAAHNHLQQNVCYYIQTLNACDSVSAPSRMMCSLSPGDSTLPVFNVATDTLLYCIATDTLDFTFIAKTFGTPDSVFVAGVSGSLFATGRVLLSASTNDLRKAILHLQWRSLCGDIGDTFDVSVLLRNNQCPQSQTQTVRIRILVTLPPAEAPPVMQCTRSIDSRSVLVRWSKPTHSRYLSHYVLLRHNPDGSYTHLAQTSSTEAFGFTDNQSLDNATTNWCYTAYAVNVCGVLGDTAEQTCTVDRLQDFPASLYIYTTTVVDNKNIMTTWTRSNENDFLKYRILRKETSSQDEFGLYRETTNINDTILVDGQTDVQRNVYCYRIRQVNDCGLENSDQNQSCSILLKGESNPFVHKIQWNEFDYWRRGVEKYDISRQDADAPAQTVATSGYKFTLYTDNHLNTDYGQYHYTIVASELQTQYTSASNTIELIQAPLLFVPNAFSPNGDGTNDTWKPVPSFVKDFNLKVYDRWGQLVFETTDKHKSFDGRLKNQDVSVDVFVYVITYTGWDGSAKTVKGNLTVIR